MVQRTLDSVKKALGSLNSRLPTSSGSKTTINNFFHENPQHASRDIFFGLQEEMARDVILSNEVLKEASRVHKILRDYLLVVTISYISSSRRRELSCGIENSLYKF